MKKILYAIIFLFITTSIFAQDVVYLNNGNVVNGKVIQNASDVVVLVFQGDTLTYRKTDVRKVQTGSTEVIMPKTPKSPYRDFTDADRGLWLAADAAFSLIGNTNLAYPMGLDIIGGYRFSEFIRIGLGVGVRGNIGYNQIDGLNRVSVPIFLSLRGNILTQKPRMCVPYWNYDAGYIVLSNAIFYDAGIGLKVGEKRNNFTVSLNYLGMVVGGLYTNGTCLKLGYEF